MLRQVDLTAALDRITSNRPTRPTVRKSGIPSSLATHLLPEVETSHRAILNNCDKQLCYHSIFEKGPKEGIQSLIQTVPWDLTVCLCTSSLRRYLFNHPAEHLSAGKKSLTFKHI